MKIKKCDGCPEKEATFDIRTIPGGTAFLHKGGVYYKTCLPIGTEGCLVHLESGLTYSCSAPCDWNPEPLDSDYLIPKEQA